MVHIIYHVYSLKVDSSESCVEDVFKSSICSKVLESLVSRDEFEIKVDEKWVGEGEEHRLLPPLLVAHIPAIVCTLRDLGNRL